MAAGQGFKTFTTGEVLTAGDVNGYLMQGINVFTNAAARDAAITAPAEGQFAFTKDNNSLWYYDGAAWVASGATGDIEGVTAGVGISGGGTSGTVTVTNSMATAIDAKGDLVPGTGADTFSRLAVGANGTVLTADSAEATGLKWAAASSGAFTLIKRSAFTTVSDTSTTFDGVFTSTYKAYRVVIEDILSSNSPPVMLYWKWRYAGPTTQTSSYYGVTTKITFNAGTLTTSTMSNDGQYSTLNIGSTAPNAMSFDVYRVGSGSSAYPLIYGMGTGYSGDIGSWTMAGSTDVARNYTGFILSAASGTITGTVSIYGLATS